ncbi:cytochrome P450 [Streptomyces sp. NPDC050658]|uniref:cytochrome P450 n=1 Tax=unclassified Streptomyces TaxID=2593676 RepID=UPI0034341631
MDDPGARTTTSTSLVFPADRTCPYEPPPSYGRLRADGPLSRVTLHDGRPVWVVTGHAEARALLADPRLSADRQNPAFPHPTPRDAALSSQVTPLVGVDEPNHARQRRLVLPTFSTRRIGSMREDIRRIADELLDTMLRQGPPADLVASFAQPLPSMVICELLGVPYADHEFFESRSHRLLTASTAAGAEGARAELEGYLRDLVTARQGDPRDALLDDLIAQQRAQGEVNRDELAGIALVLLIAGHETTTNMISLGVLTLLEHPGQWAELQADPTLLPGAVDELLRFLSVADGLLRVAVADISVAGRVIRSGDGVVMATSLVNRDGRTFARPDELDVRRPAYQHIAFGHGVHQCLGQSLARAELEIALAALHARVATLRQVRPARDLPFKPGGTIQGLLEFPVTW